MLDFDTAQEHLAQAATAPTRKETSSLEEAQGRVLATALSAQVDLPPADNSAMDGYAIRLADYEAGTALPIQQRCFAGETPEPLKPGHTIRLFTGSLMPDGADTVVMQEDTTETDNAIVINTPPAAGAHVRKKGEDVEKDQELLQPGTVLGPAQIGLLASQGINQVEVWARLKVGILTTGDELVSPGQALGRRNCTTPTAPCWPPWWQNWASWWCTSYMPSIRTSQLNRHSKHCCRIAIWS